MAVMPRTVVQRTSSNRILWFLISVIACFLIVVITTAILPTLRSGNSAQQQEIDQKVTVVTDQLQTQLETYIQSLYGTRAFMTTYPNATRLDWQKFYLNNDNSKRLPGIGLTAYIKRVPASQKAAFIAGIRNDTSINPAGYPTAIIHPESTKDEYMLVDYFEPFDTVAQSQSLAFDYSSEPTRRAAYEKARDTNSPVMTEPVKALQNTAITIFVIVLPVYDSNLPHTTPNERRTAFRGITTLGIRNQDFFDQTFTGVLDKDTAIEIYDGTELTPDHRLYDSTKQLRVLGASTDSQTQIETRTIKVADRTWTLQFQIKKTPSNFLLIPSVSGRIAAFLLSNLICATVVWQLISRFQRKKV